MKTNKIIWMIFGLLFLFVACPSDDPNAPNNPDNPLVPGEPIPPVFNNNVKRLLNFLEDNYGEKIISGQMDASWATNTGTGGSSTLDMIARVFTDTGKYPAMKGFDFIRLSYRGNPFNEGREQVDEAIEWWEGKNNGVKLLPDEPGIHGIVTFCWHWGVLADGERGAGRFYTNETNFRIPWNAAELQLDTSSAAFQTLQSDLDKVAALLKLLQEKDIPVLWRPLHEAAGGWFWWGASGSRPYIALWEYIYDYLANTKKLDNLIWVWNGQNADWVPDPGTVDIISFDWYPWPRTTPQNAQNYTSQVATFNQYKTMTKDRSERIVAMTENGGIPDPDSCKTDNAMWSWFMVWNDSDDSGKPEDQFWSTEFVNTQAHKEKVYNHSLVLTLDELPDLTKYRLE